MKYKTLQSVGSQDPGVVYKEITAEITQHHLSIGSISPIDDKVNFVEVVEEVKAKKA